MFRTWDTTLLLKNSAKALAESQAATAKPPRVRFSGIQSVFRFLASLTAFQRLEPVLLVLTMAALLTQLIFSFKKKSRIWIESVFISAKCTLLSLKRSSLSSLFVY